jgi:glucosamine-phosphate N-acetyltransferase
MNYQIKRLDAESYFNGYIDLLKQLTVVKDMTFNEYNEHLDKINKCSNIHIFNIVVNNKVVGTGTLMIEYKFIHGMKSVGHIEDIIIDNNFRGMNYGKIIVNHLIKIAKNNDCYKVILNCSPELRTFYEKCGFINKNMEMSLYFDY